MQLLALTAFVLVGTLHLSPAMAHLQLLEPGQRESAQKTGPCGSQDSMRGPAHTFRPGETITVRWTETVNHPSHYRISFDDDGTDDFADPPSMMDFYSNDTVLLDDITDVEAADQEAEITFPNITCDNCTLQVVQVMYDKPPYTVGGNDLYYQCADIILAGDPAEMGNNTMPDMGDEPADMGSTEDDMGTSQPNCGPDEFYNAVTRECEADDVPDSGSADMGTSEQPEDMMAESGDDSACSAVGAVASWPLLLVLALFGHRRRR